MPSRAFCSWVLGFGTSWGELGLEKSVALLQNFVPAGGKGSHAEINDTEPDYVLECCVSSRKMKMVQAQRAAAERNRNRTLKVMTAGIALRKLPDVLPAKPRLGISLWPERVAISDRAETVLLTLPLGKASLGQAQMYGAKLSLELNLCRVETTGSPKAESETLGDVDERERRLRDR